MISISFIVVLLAAYSYSLPINTRIDITTSEIPFTTGETIVVPDATATPQLVPDSETSNVPDIHRHHESTTSSSHEHVPREVDETTFSTSTMSSSEIPTTKSTTVEEQSTKFSFTTLETPAKFEARAIKLENDHNLIPMTSATDKTVNDDRTSIPIEQTTSGHTFSTTTGQIKDKREEETEKSEEKREEETEKSEEKREEETEKSADRREEEEEKSEQKREEETEKSEEKREEETEKSEEKRERKDFEDPSTTERLSTETTTEIIKTEKILPVKITETVVKIGETKPMGNKKNPDN